MRLVVRTVTALLVPPALAGALGLLVHGYAGSGGGFPAGVVGGICAFVLFAGLGRRAAERIVPFGAARAAAVVGTLVVVGVALLPAAFGAPPMSHRPAPGAEVARLGALELHTSLLFDAGVAAAVFGFAVTLVGLVAEEESP